MELVICPRNAGVCRCRARTRESGTGSRVPRAEISDMSPEFPERPDTFTAGAEVSSERLLLPLLLAGLPRLYRSSFLLSLLPANSVLGAMILKLLALLV